MKLLHHVKKHGKTITLHLKKHHKKYIFGILSASLMWKGISLIAAYALVHNLSFSFADIVNHENENNQQTEITMEETNENNNEQISNIEDLENNEENSNNENGNENENGNSDIEEFDDENYNENENNEDENENENSNTEEFENENEDEDGDEGNEDGDEGNEDGDEGNENGDEEGNDTQTQENGNGICDSGDVEILNPTQGDITGKNFDISRKFTNNDCENNSYTIRLRDSNEQYLDIYSGNYNTTGFNFDSTQLIGKYFSGHKIAVVSDETEVLYWIQEGGEFTIDNKTPELTDIKIEFSTKNNKLNIGDTIKIAFESDEEMTGVSMNILGQSALLEEKNGNKYIYTMDFSEKNTEGKVVYGINYSDNIGNTGYYEGYENIELDYTVPTMENFEMSYKGNNEIQITFSTNENVKAYLAYQLSGVNKSENIENTGRNHEFTIKNIRNNYKYNYSISIEDDAKNTLNIGGTFILSGNRLSFTKNEINKSELIAKIGFKTGNNDIKNQFNSFESCAENIEFIKLDLPIKGKTANVKMPKFSDQNINKLTNAFTVVLIQRIEEKDLSQNALNEISEDLNNFLTIVKLIKDDKNECKQNKTKYYINRFKKTLIKYGLIQ